MRAERVPVLTWLERCLIVLGVSGLAYYGYRTVEAKQFRQEQAAALETLQTRDHEPTLALSRVSPVPGALALLDIPRLKISTPVLSGDDEATLALGVGHLPDTPRPWEPGNSAFAAHRDGLFGPLRNIRIGDEVRVRSQQGDFTYRVTGTRIVEPDDLSVLAPASTDTLTLITCYPFTYVGHAPQRFIVHAEKIAAERRTKN